MWTTALVDWFKDHQRSLPWRDTLDPYHILVSEFMAQQTQIKTVIPYFNRWMVRYPTLDCVANASDDDIMKSWEGLGYYSRARHLQQAAKIIVNERGGHIPSLPNELVTLPGVGDYIASAVASIAFDYPIAVVDGNVLRVMTRFFGIYDDIGKSKTKRGIQDRLNRLIQALPPAQFNQGMMELGALVCTPSSPDCGACPIHAMCYATNMDRVTDLPVKKKKLPTPHYNVVVGVIQRASDHRYLITKRKKNQLLGGLWEFPGGKVGESESLDDGLHREIKEEVNLTVQNNGLLCQVNHAYSHFKITLHAYECTVEDDGPLTLASADDHRWVVASELSDYAFPKANRMVIHAILDRS